MSFTADSFDLKKLRTFLFRHGSPLQLSQMECNCERQSRSNHINPLKKPHALDQIF
jgi:hypothetical protein